MDDDDDDEVDESAPWNVYDVSSVSAGEKSPKITSRYPCLARLDGDITRETWLRRRQQPYDHFESPDIGRKYRLPAPPPEALRKTVPKPLSQDDAKMLGATIGRRWGKICATFIDPATGRKVHFYWDNRSFALVDLVDEVQRLAAAVLDRVRKRA